MRYTKKILNRLFAAALIFCVAFSAIGGGMVAEAAALNTESTAFSDVPQDAWYAEAANWCKENGIMAGTSDTTFSPDGIMTRAMLATVLYRIAESPDAGMSNFTDVTAGSWYANAVSWAAETGIVTGYGNGLFGTNDPVTREQMAAILWRYADSPEAEAAPFTDADQIASYARPAVDWARFNNIMSGVAAGRFDPKGNVTRAQVATILYRYLNLEDTEPEQPVTEPPVDNGIRTLSGKQVAIHIGEKSYTIDLYDNPTANDLIAQLPLTLKANDYAGWDEKVIRLQSPLSMKDAPDGDNPEIPEVGYYHPGQWIALYYGHIGYWSGKVPLGRINASVDELRAIPNNASVVIELVK